MTEPQEFSLGMQIDIVIREIAMRQQVYPGFVARKKMSQHQADLQIAGMKAVLATLQSLKRDE